MPIDFFTSPCSDVNGNCRKPGIVCKRTTTDKSFGLCDPSSPSTLPAYIDTQNKSNWIAQVINNASKEITFKAIDHCVPIFRSNGDMEKRCDGMLIIDNNIIFVELKDRASGTWVKDGREQLTTIIKVFKANYRNSAYNIVSPHIANHQRPLPVTSNKIEIQKFYDDTKLILKVDRNITI